MKTPPDNDVNPGLSQSDQDREEQANLGTQPAGDSSPEPKKLTKEEQMARFEEQLKDEDWGHQPC